MIFLYTREAKIDDETRKLIVASGYMPIEVESFATVRILPAPVPQATLDLITRAALQTVEETPLGRQNFASRLCIGLLAKKS